MTIPQHSRALLSTRLLIGGVWVSSATAGILALYAIETIVGSCPTMAVLGFALATRLRNTTNFRARIYALLNPLLTGIIALLIFGLKLQPPAAHWPVSILLVGYSVVTAPLAWRTALSIVSDEKQTDRFAWRFSLRALFVLMSILCVVFTIARFIDWGHEMSLFATYGLSTIAISLAMLIFFQRRRRTNALVSGNYSGDGSTP